MSVRRLQGLALLLSAVCLLLGAFGPRTVIFVTIGIILFILAIPAVYSTQPTGWIGLAGIVLLELAALIALGFRLDLVPPSLGDSLSLTSAILGMLGAVIVGWLTTREHVFPAWVGWVFMVQGLLNFLGWVIQYRCSRESVSDSRSHITDCGNLRLWVLYLPNTQ